MSFFISRSRASNPSSTLIAFYDKSGHDYNGRYLSDILKWGVGKLESSHDYIQMLFPLPEESGVNWNAPTVDRQVFDAFHSRQELRENLRMSFQKMLWFYGFELSTEGPSGKIKVIKGSNYGVNSENWDTRFDHNHLRITRIIRCLRVLGLDAEAQAFRAALEESTIYVSARSRDFWRRAAERTLNLRPDMDITDELDTSVGPKFLREYEEKRKERAQNVLEESSKLQSETGTECADAGGSGGIEEPSKVLEDSLESMKQEPKSMTRGVRGSNLGHTSAAANEEKEVD